MAKKENKRKTSGNIKKKYLKNKIIKAFYEKECNTKNKIILAVVYWANAKNTVLEYRRYYFDNNSDEWRPLKNAGIDTEALQVVLDNIDEIKELLQHDITPYKEELERLIENEDEMD